MNSEKNKFALHVGNKTDSIDCQKTIAFLSHLYTDTTVTTVLSIY